MGLFSSNNNLGSPRPPLEGLYTYILVVFLGFAAADLSILKLRPLMLPDKAPPTKPKSEALRPMTTLGNYRVIEDKNIFSANREIPKALGFSEEEEVLPGLDGPAVLSKLPIQLLGTIVHINPARSVASISLKTKNKSKSVKLDDEVPNLFKVILIERRKVTFKNLNNSRKEYIEITDDSKINFSTSVKKDLPPSEIAQTGKFEFEVLRTDIDKYTNDLSSILRQARMLPNTVNGKVQGFRFVSIQPDSIYSKLGFKVNDIIEGVNGEPINSPSKAMELYQALKTSDTLKLKVTRDGKSQTFNYNIK